MNLFIIRNPMLIESHSQCNTPFAFFAKKNPLKKRAAKAR
ncbi:hypothetical protein HM1_2822 [Heliomicrobium modesticaldum Ice1]|uniref:Uncharacterized protein n=1 Tax=Heliobacterium modesticaldum (strain ATCC 51547 / Ice1) TaxID=498761 RepID=B0TCG3_HELMI|nr:hypothetical protein HM1_2822 [Heliomicrobium modesticaldum Ice1]